MVTETPRARPTLGDALVPSAGAHVGSALRGGVTLMCCEHDVSFGPGSFSIGRGSSCDVVLDDSLVSREHAKIVVTDDEVTISDTRSANGVYVNGTRIHRTHRLHDGDRVLVGTREMSVFAFEPRAADSDERPTVEIDPEKGEASNGAEEAANAMTDSERSAPTERADAFKFVGRIADKMLSMGKYAEAESVLFDHMTKILHGARADLPVPRDVLDAAGGYAMKLAQATRRGLWIDYAVELHTLARQQMSGPVVDALCEAMAIVTSVDESLYASYLESLKRAADSMSPAELLLCNRLECVTLPSARDR